MRIINVLCCLAALTLLASCAAAPYKGYSGGPTAYIRFVDNMGEALLVERKSAVHFFDDADCTTASSIDQTGWIPIPANKRVTFHQFWDTRGAGLIQGYCGVWGQLELREGQRVEARFQFSAVGLRWNCLVQSREIGPTGEPMSRVQLFRPTSPQCKY